MDNFANASFSPDLIAVMRDALEARFRRCRIRLVQVMFGPSRKRFFECQRGRARSDHAANDGAGGTSDFAAELKAILTPGFDPPRFECDPGSVPIARYRRDFPSRDRHLQNEDRGRNRHEDNEGLHGVSSEDRFGLERLAAKEGPPGWRPLDHESRAYA